ncbi:ATP-grasp fold amidoligase family protein [Nesterenkonia natronophila]|uniref:ATP-grasp fold amidoligase family protein n=1 Tax=Nesterenkonia natronophila TaxID=2174932 RepID=UPI001CEFAD04|nr:ATP-grasp fold amidoligase family protein [Nesterenkonia natronophila]
MEDKTLGGTKIGLPKQHAVLTSTEQITPEVLGERVALKFAQGWSAKGVMLLERTGEDTYFDHMALREWSLEGIREHQDAVATRFRRKNPAWIVEELLRGAQPGMVPFDYKFYMFQGQIGMVAQIDRNSSPPRMVKLDRNLKPLIAGRDYRFKPQDLQAGVPIVPRSAVMLSRWAIELSHMTDAPFVRVDLYDTANGPYFGEFTFSSGAEFRGTVTYSDRLLNHFDKLFRDAEKRLEGEALEQPRGWSTLLQSLDPEELAPHPQIPLTEYERYAYFLYNQGSLGGARLAQAQERLLKDDGHPKVTRYLSDAHRAAGRRAQVPRKPITPVILRTARKVYRKASQRSQRPG